MSKTTGNVMDPIDVVDRLGADALRYSLVTGSTPGNDVPLAMEKIEANRYCPPKFVRPFGYSLCSN